MGLELSDRIKRLHENLARLEQGSNEIKFDGTTRAIITNAIDSSSNDNEVAYLEHLLTELRLEDNTYDVLLYLNFNSRKYFQYYTQVVASRLESEDASLGKLDKTIVNARLIE